MGAGDDAGNSAPMRYRWPPKAQRFESLMLRWPRQASGVRCRQPTGAEEAPRDPVDRGEDTPIAGVCAGTDDDGDAHEGRGGCAEEPASEIGGSEPAGRSCGWLPRGGTPWDGSGEGHPSWPAFRQKRNVFRGSRRPLHGRQVDDCSRHDPRPKDGWLETTPGRWLPSNASWHRME